VEQAQGRELSSEVTSSLEKPTEAQLKINERLNIMLGQTTHALINNGSLNGRMNAKAITW